MGDSLGPGAIIELGVEERRYFSYFPDWEPVNVNPGSELHDNVVLTKVRGGRVVGQLADRGSCGRRMAVAVKRSWCNKFKRRSMTGFGGLRHWLP